MSNNFKTKNNFNILISLIGTSFPICYGNISFAMETYPKHGVMGLGVFPALKILVEQGESLATSGIGQKESMKLLMCKMSQLNLNSYKMTT